MILYSFVETIYIFAQCYHQCSHLCLKGRTDVVSVALLYLSWKFCTKYIGRLYVHYNWLKWCLSQWWELEINNTSWAVFKSSKFKWYSRIMPLQISKWPSDQWTAELNCIFYHNFNSNTHMSVYIYSILRWR